MDKRYKDNNTNIVKCVLYLISTEEDMLISTKDACHKCIENKLNCTILHTYDIPDANLPLWASLPIKRIKTSKCSCNK